MNIKDKLTVILTTHILPSAPSTHIIEECINSIREKFEGINECVFKVYCDVKNPEEWDAKEYLNNLKQIENIEVIETPNSNLRMNYINAMGEVNTPYVLFCEHDWTFLDHIQTSNIISCLDENPSVNFIRFNKRDNNKAHSDNPEPGDADFWETHIEEALEIKEQSLMKTNCIATHPHIIRINTLKTWLPLLKTWSIEWDLHSAYNKEIKHMGFEDAHRKWGIYNYGSKQTKKIVKHIDGSNSGRT